MKFAKEVIGLMAAYPGRDFKMAELVRIATGARTLTVKERTSVRQGVLRAVNALIEHGQVLRRPSRPGVRNAAVYRWKSAT
ncbi:hypothetical protein [Achromobacter denitrificans]|uniref:hypothetical protein n=1 Tax=Achromobacter denitrificans TaxID=32002 RepID=UPI0023E85C95|nr:hypothetical protein [Achromobacter denitrificans]MDF3850691.1 hypothetical protein [Achromobacter denitrificans]MDX3877042.1 hypothetical protein [Achromobacter sp.]